MPFALTWLESTLEESATSMATRSMKPAIFPWLSSFATQFKEGFYPLAANILWPLWLMVVNLQRHQWQSGIVGKGLV